jgi:L-aspartate oxidase
MDPVDVLVIGSGVAGLTYALKVAEFADVTLVTKKEGAESNTNYAQGGIAAVMAADDSPELHIADTLEAGAGLCDGAAVRKLVVEGPARVRELMEWGAEFTRDPTSSTGLSLGMEGGHSRRRIVRAADLTGREVERALVAAVGRHPRVRVLEHHMAVDLLVAEGAVRGATVLDTRSGTVEAWPARLTALATGGCGQTYLHTTNPRIATGDGVAMAWRAAAVIANLEFIQFHPTTLYHPEARSFLISEAVRGEGGILRLQNGEPFMRRYDVRADLAPRDIVARAIDAELKASGDDFVLLDVTHLPADTVREHFPNIHARCLELGLDITREPIPVVPGAHYSCGGVRADLSARTSLDRLYAIGEVSCTGVHGANRLASNSLLEALVWADAAARDSAARLESGTLPAAIPDGVQRHMERHARGSEISPEFLQLLRQLVQTLMWLHVGIVRSNHRLQQARREVALLSEAVERLFAGSRVTEPVLELRNLTLVGRLIIESALQRHESRGLHYNVDYRQRDDANCRHDTLLART